MQAASCGHLVLGLRMQTLGGVREIRDLMSSGKAFAVLIPISVLSFLRLPKAERKRTWMKESRKR